MPGEKICLGTKVVVLASSSLVGKPKPKPKRSLPVEGLLVVYQPVLDGNDEDEDHNNHDLNDETDTKPKASAATSASHLHLELGTRETIWQGDVPLAQVKVSDPTLVAPYLLRVDVKEYPDITVRFEYLLNEEDEKESSTVHSIQLIVQQRLALSGLQKFLYRGVLTPQPQRSSIGSSSSSSTATTTLHFMNTLGKAVNVSLADTQRVQSKWATERERAKHWKATAQQLDTEVWQAEKDQLLNNFLKLWNERQRRAKRELQDVQEELERTQLALAAVTASGRGGKRPRALQLLDEEAEQDVDDEPLPLEQVAALAAGRAVRPTASSSKRAPILKPGNTISVAALQQQVQDYQKRNQKSPSSKRKRPKDDDDDDEGVEDDDDDDLAGSDKDEDDSLRGISVPRKSTTTQNKQRTPRFTTSRTEHKSHVRTSSNAKPSINTKRVVSSPSSHAGGAAPDNSDEEAMRAAIRAGIQATMSSSSDENTDDQAAAGNKTANKTDERAVDEEEESDASF